MKELTTPEEVRAHVWSIVKLVPTPGQYVGWFVDGCNTKTFTISTDDYGFSISWPGFDHEVRHSWSHLVSGGIRIFLVEDVDRSNEGKERCVSCDCKTEMKRDFNTFKVRLFCPRCKF